MSRGPNTTPRFIATPKLWKVSFTTANTALDGTGTIATVAAAATAASGGEGARIDRVIVKANGNTTNGMIRLFRRVAAGTWALVHELSVTGSTPSATVQATGGGPLSTNPLYWDPTDEPNGKVFVLEPGDELGVSTHNGESFVATAIGGEL